MSSSGWRSGAGWRRFFQSIPCEAQFWKTLKKLRQPAPLRHSLQDWNIHITYILVEHKTNIRLLTSIFIIEKILGPKRGGKGRGCWMRVNYPRSYSFDQALSSPAPWPVSSSGEISSLEIPAQTHHPHTHHAPTFCSAALPYMECNVVCYVALE